MAHLGILISPHFISFFNFSPTKMLSKLVLIGFILFIFAFFASVESRPSLSESVVAPVPQVKEQAVPPTQGDSEEGSDSGEEEPAPAAGAGSTSKQCCPPGWVQFESHCYRGIVDPPLPFFSVSKQCRTYGAHFVSIHSKEEYAFVKQNFDLNKYWIGVVSYENGRHENQDGTSNNFQAFDDPVWDASESHPYICEMNHCATYGSVGAGKDEE